MGEAASLTVKTARTPDQAIAEIDKNIPYMIYLDLNLGTRSGLTLLNEQQSYSDTTSVPVVIISADGARLHPEDWQSYGVVAIVDKATLTPETIEETLAYGH
jgi:DNA-binding response OmpR family regulator